MTAITIMLLVQYILKNREKKSMKKKETTKINWVKALDSCKSTDAAREYLNYIINVPEHGLVATDGKKLCVVGSYNTNKLEYVQIKERKHVDIPEIMTVTPRNLETDNFPCINQIIPTKNATETFLGIKMPECKFTNKKEIGYMYLNLDKKTGETFWSLNQTLNSLCAIDWAQLDFLNGLTVNIKFFSALNPIIITQIDRSEKDFLVIMPVRMDEVR
jgi:hypothetical protein